MEAGCLLYGAMLFAVAVLAIALPLMAVSLALALEIASVFDADPRGSVLGSVVGGAIIPRASPPLRKRSTSTWLGRRRSGQRRSRLDRVERSTLPPSQTARKTGRRDPISPPGPALSLLPGAPRRPGRWGRSSAGRRWAGSARRRRGSP